jgi:hypothetical protein
MMLTTKIEALAGTNRLRNGARGRASERGGFRSRLQVRFPETKTHAAHWSAITKYCAAEGSAIAR